MMTTAVANNIEFKINLESIFTFVSKIPPYNSDIVIKFPTLMDSPNLNDSKSIGVILNKVLFNLQTNYTVCFIINLFIIQLKRT